jgi:hypothetical protein
MDLNNKTQVELKALAYDCFALTQSYQNAIKSIEKDVEEINEKIMSLVESEKKATPQEEQPVTETEVVPEVV